MDMNQFAGTEGRFLKAADLKGRSVEVTIESVDSEDFTETDQNGGQVIRHKAILHLKGKDKGIVLNVTNTRALITAFGENSEGWYNKKIILSERQTPMGPGIGVTPAPQSEDFDDDIPF